MGPQSCRSIQSREGNATNYWVQTSLQVGAVNDPLEHEADAMADQVMRIPENSLIQRKYQACEEEDHVRRAPLASFIQKKGASSGMQTSEAVSHKIATTRGKGHSLPQSTQGFMESRFGSDFSNVNIHTGTDAAQMSQELGAKAFTVGNDIYFNQGQYNPNSNSGKHLLAHELTHTLQQKGSRLQIQRYPNFNPPPGPYTAGRPAHNHPALGIWHLVQADAMAYCLSHTESVTPPEPLPQIPIPIPPTDIRGKSECACAIMTPLQVLDAAKTFQMLGKPLAISHLNHYISGGGVTYFEHINLDTMLHNDAGARGVIAAALANNSRGHVFIHQSDYSDQNYRLAFGGIDRVDYQLNPATREVHVWFKDRYDFHPSGYGHTNMGAGDHAPPGRPTNCVHHAAVEAKLSGAADYWMMGHATVPLSLFTTAPPQPADDTLL